MRIAIVDDLAAERALLEDRLEQQLHRRNVQADILEYESGETFLEAARKAPFTAAFLDIYMDGPQPEGVKGEIQVAAPDHPARGA